MVQEALSAPERGPEGQVWGAAAVVSGPYDQMRSRARAKRLAPARQRPAVPRCSHRSLEYHWGPLVEMNLPKEDAFDCFKLNYKMEIWKDYKVKYGLEKHYDTLLIGDARAMQFNYYDVCFLGDILEHMTKEDAVSLVRKLKDTCRYLIISIPIIDYPQDSMHGNPYQAHIKDDWSHKEVMETFPEVKKFWTGQTIGVYLIW